MTRIIKASEVKPGMTIRWEQEDLVFQFPVDRNVQFGDLRLLRTPMRKVVMIPPDTEVTVLSEPAPPQPEEPTWFGARVVVDGKSAIHAHPSDIEAWVLMDRDGETAPCSWRELCTLGLVQVIPDQGWTAPADTPEVPELADEWDTWEDVPEGVTVANPELNYQYRKTSGKIETISPISGGVWGETSLPLWTYPGPWTRVTDA